MRENHSAFLWHRSHCLRELMFMWSEQHMNVLLKIFIPGQHDSAIWITTGLILFLIGHVRHYIVSTFSIPGLHRDRSGELASAARTGCVTHTKFVFLTKINSTCHLNIMNDFPPNCSFKTIHNDFIVISRFIIPSV